METPAQTSFYVKPETSPEREAFNGRLGQKNAAPLWNVLGQIVPREPQNPFELSCALMPENVRCDPLDRKMAFPPPLKLRISRSRNAR